MADGYPSDWDKIAEDVKQAAGWECEHCHHPHDPGAGHCLTVHHLDGNPANCSRKNLVALCQVCHLHIQARFTPGQLVMDFARPAWMARRGLG
jgi:5-methylcytosine-specific restriction endonuclease McrA